MKIRIIIFLATVALFSSCEESKELMAFTQCKFRMASVEKPIVAGVNLSGTKSVSDISLTSMAKLGIAFASGNIPLQFTVNVEGNNPNTQTAAINKLDWILTVDEKQIAESTLNERIELSPNGGKTIIPLKIACDLKQLTEKETLKNLLSLAMNIGGEGKEASRVGIKIRPYITVAGQSIAMHYIKLDKEFK